MKAATDSAAAAKLKEEQGKAMAAALELAKKEAEARVAAEMARVEAAQAEAEEALRASQEREEAKRKEAGATGTDAWSKCRLCVGSQRAATTSRGCV